MDKGQVESNCGVGRVSAASGWVIEAWYGNGAKQFHTAHRFGALTASNVALYKSACAVAYNSGESAWLAACGSTFAAWYAALPSDPVRALVFEAARFAGEFGLEP